MTIQNSRWIIFDGDFVAGKEPVVNATSRGFMYGDGIFETLRVYKGQTLFFDRHIARMNRGLQLIGVDTEHIPRQKMLKNQLRRLLHKNGLLAHDAIVRFQFWRGGRRGYNPQSGADIHYTATAFRCPDYEGIFPALATVSIRRIPSESLPSGAKLTNGINYILAAQEAAARGADDALMQTIDGWISETTIANIFWISGESVFTPSADCDMIPGITREAVIEMIDRHPTFVVREGCYSPETVYEAEAVALCNSVREIMPVRGIDGHTFNTDHPVLNKLQRLYSDLRNQDMKGLPDIE